MVDEDLIDLARQKKRLVWRISEPQQTIVVLGRSSSDEKEAYIDSCRSANVPVFRRKGGGCSVVLAPGMLVFSVAYPPRAVNANTELVEWTELIQYTLELQGVRELSIRGTSDLCFRDKKILGSCLYRTKDAAFYQASLLVRAEVDQFETFLKHPPRMPEYRGNRSHNEFVTTLSRVGYELSCDQVSNALSVAMAERFLMEDGGTYGA